MTAEEEARGASGEIRRFAADDIPFALAQTSREGWDCTESIFHVCLAHDPDGCFVAEVGGQRVGMVTTMRFAGSAWVGNLIVLPDHRRGGIGLGLMVHALKHLEAGGVRTIRLEGDPLGIGIYRRLGFVDQFESLRFRKEPPHVVRRGEVTRLNAAELAGVAEFDRVAFGDDRSRLLALLLEMARAAYCVQVGGRVAGYAMALPSAEGVRFGPCVAIDRAVAETLLSAVLGDYPDRAVVLGVPGVNRAAVDMFEGCGFTQTRSSLRMLRGEAAASSDADNVFAIANGAMG